MIDEHEVSLRLFDLATNKALFVCIHNSGQSQMAEAFFNQMAKGKAVASSAGTSTVAHIDSNVVKAMRKVGIEIGNQKPISFSPSADRRG